jgi:predicted ATPase/class 3 adenylate cyclase
MLGLIVFPVGALAPGIGQDSFTQGPSMMADTNLTPTADSLPTGVVTLVFTDLEDSSALCERHGTSFEPARATHFRILRETLARNNGAEVHTAGDAVFAAFAIPMDAVRWTIEAQRALIAEAWPPAIGPVRVRMGMFTGQPILSDNNGLLDYFGSAPNRAARVTAAAHGGQILAAESTQVLSRQEAQKSGIGFEDLGFHRLKGVGEEHLFQLRAEGLPERFPVPLTLGSVRHNLPLPQTPFFSRDTETSALTSLIAAGKRLITVTGFGGMGKTRIALQAAELCADQFPGGAWWSDLSESRDGEAMVQKIGFDLGLDMQPPPSARDRLLGWLREQKHVLLILDNLEQVSGVEAVVKDILAASPEIVCLITSRRRFGLQAETVYDLPSLPPDIAIPFFVERARARESTFEITPDNSEDVVVLCGQLDGVPLALELAAARATTMTPRQMVARLGERFKLLQTRSPDLPERQRGIRAAIDWSYQLLDADLRTLFSQLSVFSRTGFTLEDAEAICQSLDVMDGVAFLRDHSLLQSATDAASQTTRFHMPEALREYATERLAELSADLQRKTHESHAAYYLAFAEKRLGQLRTSDEAAALKELEFVSDDLKAAEVWTGGESDATLARRPDLHFRLCLVLGNLQFRRGFLRTAEAYFDSGIRSATAVTGSSVKNHISLLRGSAELHVRLRQLDTARKRLESAHALASDADLEPEGVDGEADEQNLYGHIALGEGDFEVARSHFRQALGLLAAANASPITIALLYNNLGLTEYEDPDGDRELGIDLLKQALSMRRVNGDTRGVASTLNNIGNFAFLKERWDEAAGYYAESLGIERSLNHAFGVAVTLNNFGEAKERADDQETALRCFAAVAQLCFEGGSPHFEIADGHFKRISDGIGLSPEGQEDLRRRVQGRNLESISSWAIEGCNDPAGST